MEKKEQRWKAAVVTLSDKGYAGEREDKSGPLLCGMLEEAGYEVTEVRLLPDEQKMIEQCLCELADEKKVDLIATTGGTGFAPRDCTPEATLAVATKNAPGIAVLPSLEHGLAILTGNASECGKPVSEGK